MYLTFLSGCVESFSSEIFVQIVDDVDRGFFEDLFSVVEHEHFLHPADPFNCGHVLNHASLLLPDRDHRLPQLVVPDQSICQLLYTRRPKVNVIELHVLVLLLGVYHPDGLLQLTLDQGDFVPVHDPLHVADQDS